MPAALALSGSGAFALAARPAGDRYELDGRIDLDAARVAYGTWFAKPEGVPCSAAFTGALSRDEARTPQVALSAVTVRLHTVEATGRATVALGERIAGRGELDTGDTPLNGWERLVPALGGGALSGRARLRASWALDAAHPPAYTASVRLTDARAAVGGWAKPIEGVTGTVALERGVVVLKSVTARVDDGAVTLRGRIDPFGLKPAFDLDVGVNRVQAADVLARFTSLKDFLSGRLTGQVVAAGGIGVAPGAEWIGCVNLARNLGSPAWYLELHAVHARALSTSRATLSRTATPARAAHVLNNSWGCPELEGCDPGTLAAATAALRAAGIYVVASAGNGGPACGTVNDPPPSTRTS